MEDGNEVKITPDGFIKLADYIGVKTAENARLECKNETLEEKVCQMAADIDRLTMEVAMWKAKYEAQVKANEQLQIMSQQQKMVDMSDMVGKLFQDYMLLSQKLVANFMHDKVTDLSTAMLLRGFVMAATPEAVLPTMLGIINRVMSLPDVPKSVAEYHNTFNNSNVGQIVEHTDNMNVDL